MHVEVYALVWQLWEYPLSSSVGVLTRFNVLEKRCDSPRGKTSPDLQLTVFTAAQQLYLQSSVLGKKKTRASVPKPIRGKMNYFLTNQE